ncbi:hypothetical protein GGTG_05597 [Gaeumannomyces tritici R3-111a-1]|uniref:Uncharacterized protein n=1 Tax=Gaeumannomyces tritici (strain R3-111a-1) TaxID=644352 RepID=J3NWD3_GAET3|nr:hypothetical protein GGTG_05597 [Gaeumannomyces tritici R3-111a-1]EJT75665.1 hypothetical protein GGTG_05597 [Gaeumannomyces tritici R3-111a-1]
MSIPSGSIGVESRRKGSKRVCPMSTRRAGRGLWVGTGYEVLNVTLWEGGLARVQVPGIRNVGAVDQPGGGFWQMEVRVAIHRFGGQGG